MKYYFLLVILFFYLSGYASNTPPIVWVETFENSSVDISKDVLVFVDSMNLGVASIKDDLFLPSTEVLPLLNPKELKRYKIYFRLEVRNATLDTVNLFLKLPGAEKIILYLEGQEKFGGFLSSADKRDERFMPTVFELKIAPGALVPLNGHLRYSFFRTNFSKHFYLQHATQVRSDYFNSLDQGIEYKFILLTVGFVSSVFFMFVFMLSHFVQTRDKLYFYYSLYLLSVLLYSLISFESVTNIAFPSFSVFHDWTFFRHPLGIFVSIAYFYFIVEFLDLKAKMTKLYRHFSKLIVGLYLYIVIGILLSSFLHLYALENTAYFIVRFLWLIPSVWFLIMIWRKQLPYGKIVLMGSIVLLFGSVISLILSVTSRHEGFWGIPIIYTQLGILIEIIFFSIGIGRKTRDLERERLGNKEALIQQLVTNEMLQSEINLKLQEEVKMHEIEQEKHALAFEKDKAEMKTVQLEKDLAKTELLALRSQINPHFIFNSLNSIKSYILRNGPLEAAEYLTSFSNLMRSILHYSKSQQISLKEEIEMLLLYVKLEQMRFPEKFEFVYFQNSTVSLGAIKVPPLILQPYVENAIWHGLLHLETGGILKIEIREDVNCLVVVIEDNGIGRKRAEGLKANSYRKFKSMGMGITQNRIDLHNQINAKGINVVISNVYENDNTGTRVIVTVNCTKTKKINDESNIN